MSARYNLDTISLVNDDIEAAIRLTQGGHEDPLTRYITIVNHPGGLGKLSKRGHLVTAALTDFWFISKGLVDAIEMEGNEFLVRETVKNLCTPAKTVDDSTWKGIRDELSPQGRFMNFHQSLFPASIVVDEGDIGDYSEAAKKIISRSKRAMEISISREETCPNKRVGCPAQLQTMVNHVMAFSANLWPQYFEDS